MNANQTPRLGHTPRLVSLVLILALILNSAFISIAAATPANKAPESSGAQSAPADSTAGQPSSTPGAPRIRLAAGEFDPLVTPEPAGLPDALRLSAYPGDGTGYYLVQFQGPIAASDVDALTAAGAETFDYIPDFSFIVKMNSATRAAIEGTKSVR